MQDDAVARVATMHQMKHFGIASRLADHATGVGAAAIVLAPLATVAMPFRTGLVAQAVAQLVFTLAALAAGVRASTLRDTLTTVRRPILVGLALHLAATTLGTIVALARGNDPIRLAGQLLALALVPLAAATLVAATRVERWRSLATGLAAAFSLAAVVQIVGLGEWPSGPISDLSFRLPNSLSLAGRGTLVLALAVCLLRGPGVATRLLGGVATLLVVVLVVLTRIRTFLIGLPIVAVTLAAIALARGRRPLVRAGITAAGATLLVLLVPASAWLWWRAPRSPLPVEPIPIQAADAAAQYPGSARSGLAFTLLATLVAPREDLVRVTGHIACETNSLVLVRLQRLQPGLRLSRASRTEVLPVQDVPVAFVLVVPGDGARLALEASRPASSTCRLLDVKAERLGPVALAPAVTTLWVALRRPPDPDPEGTPSALADDASLAFRLKEARALVTAIRAGSAWEVLFGRGLGATFQLDTAGFDNKGNVVSFGETNFIHNLYLFLFYKLGAVGAALFLAALLLWTIESGRAALAFAPASSERLFAAGAAAAWVSYAVMGLTAPHLVTFGIAPLLGFLLAATAHLVPRSAADHEAGVRLA